MGPSATVATLSASTVALVATASTGSADYIALTVALTLMVGVIYIAGGLARMGFVARFFARPVLEGFIVGLGLYIAIGQVPKVVGIAKPSGDTLAVLANTIDRRREAGNGPRSPSGSPGWSRCSRSRASRRSSRA